MNERRFSAGNSTAAHLSAILSLCGVLAAASPAAAAGGPSKEQCVEAHSKGQDAREAGEISLARKLFLSCAQASCPTAIQGDCARFSEDLDRVQPSVSLAARDSNQTDLPDTTVYIDGVLVATRLDDGKLHDVDPGRHTVKFVNGSREVTTTLIINQGEKARPLVGSFASDHPSVPAASEKPTSAATLEPKRSSTPLILVGVGGAAIVGGVVLGVVGLGKVPSNCSLSTHDCAAPPGDPAFNSAQTGVTLADVGIGVGIAGVAAVTSGLIWYFKSPKVIQQGRWVTPWFTERAGGLAISGSL